MPTLSLACGSAEADESGNITEVRTNGIKINAQEPELVVIETEQGTKLRLRSNSPINIYINEPA